MRDQQPANHTRAKKGPPKPRTPEAAKSTPPSPQDDAIQPIEVPERSAWERENESEYVCNLILTLSAKYVGNFMATKPQLPNDWGRQAVMVLFLRDFTQALPMLMHRSPQEIKEALDAGAYKCMGFIEGMAHEAALHEQMEAERE
jgi:hypothetical protein